LSSFPLHPRGRRLFNGRKRCNCAGGTTRDRTYSAIMTIRDRARLNVAGHLTCVDATKVEVLDVANRYRAMGVKHIVALRGDPPKGAATFEAATGGFQTGADLVEGLAEFLPGVVIRLCPIGCMMRFPMPKAMVIGSCCRRRFVRINVMNSRERALSTCIFTRSIIQTSLTMCVARLVWNRKRRVWRPQQTSLDHSANVGAASRCVRILGKFTKRV